MARTTACAPNTSASSETSSGRRTAAELTDTLSAPASSTACASSTDLIPPPIVNGMKTSSAVRRASSTIVSRSSCDAVMSRKTSSSAPSASYRTASSTGSPASRMLMKLVPLTTRPLSTSRQGMTRFSSMLLTNLRGGRSLAADVEDVVRVGDREAALVDRLAGDHAGQVHQPQVAQRAQVVGRGDPARVDPAAADRVADPAHLVQVGAVQHPVAVGVRVDELLDAAVLHALDHVLGQHLRGLGPARNRHVAAAHVDRHDHADAPRRDRLVQELDV